MLTTTPRSIRSYVCRKGKMGSTQQKAWQQLWPIYGLSPEEPGFLDLKAIFGRDADKTLEIGFGDGHSLAAMALSAPEKDFIGIEVYQVGIGKLLSAIEKHKLTNLRIFCGDAVEIIEQRILDESLDTLQIFFADPWPKSRHHKRRLVQASFVSLVAKKLKNGGIFHLATDWMDYAYQMMSVISSENCLENVIGTGEFFPRPEFRPLTKYEQRGLKLGHQSWDLIFKRVQTRSDQGEEGC